MFDNPVNSTTISTLFVWDAYPQFFWIYTTQKGGTSSIRQNIPLIGGSYQAPTPLSWDIVTKHAPRVLLCIVCWAFVWTHQNVVCLLQMAVSKVGSSKFFEGRPDTLYKSSTINNQATIVINPCCSCRKGDALRPSVICKTGFLIEYMWHVY